MADKQLQVIGWYQPHSRAGDYDGTITDPHTGVVTTPPSLTKQSEMAACDINNIVREFGVTGQIQHINAQAQQGMYADLTTWVDYQESLHVVQQAQLAFASLPSAVRSEMDNDPMKFLAFVGDPANRERLYEWGLAQRPETGPLAAPADASAAAPNPPETPPTGS